VNVDAVDQEAGLVTEEMEVEDIDHDHEIDIGPLDHIGDPDQETEKEGVVLGPIQGKEGDVLGHAGAESTTKKRITLVMVAQDQNQREMSRLHKSMLINQSQILSYIYLYLTLT
jgi:hypothetical protein